MRNIMHVILSMLANLCAYIFTCVSTQKRTNNPLHGNLYKKKCKELVVKVKMQVFIM